MTQPKRIFEHDWVPDTGYSTILDLEPTYWSECSRCGLIMNDDIPTTWSKPDDDHVYRRCPKCKPAKEKTDEPV